MDSWLFKYKVKFERISALYDKINNFFTSPPLQNQMYLG